MKPRSRDRRWAVVPLLVIVAAAACGDDDSTSRDPSATEDAVPADPIRDEGAAAYQTFCAECHGADLRGTEKGPSHLSIVYEPGHHSDDAFRLAVLRGARQHHFDFGDMNAIEGITDEEVEQIIEFVRAEQERLGFER